MELPDRFTMSEFLALAGYDPGCIDNPRLTKEVKKMLLERGYVIKCVRDGKRVYKAYVKNGVTAPPPDLTKAQKALE